METKKIIKKTYGVIVRIIMEGFTKGFKKPPVLNRNIEVLLY